MTTKPEAAEAAGYLAGLVDGEGCIYVTRGVSKGRRYRNFGIIIGVTDHELLDGAAAACDKLGIAYRRSLAHRPLPSGRLMGYLEIGRVLAVRRFAVVVPIKHHGKIAKLEALLAAIPPLSGRCRGCEGPLDDRTRGCRNCDARHSQRRVTARSIDTPGNPGA